MGFVISANSVVALAKSILKINIPAKKPMRKKMKNEITITNSDIKSFDGTLICEKYPDFIFT